jgi:hypothetical protein
MDILEDYAVSILVASNGVASHEVWITSYQPQPDMLALNWQTSALPSPENKYEVNKYGCGPRDLWPVHFHPLMNYWIVFDSQTAGYKDVYTAIYENSVLGQDTAGEKGVTWATPGLNMFINCP